ncbi:MAG: hypothetical protein ACO3NV_01195 [Schleiferiaceae bacterium]|jgi:hypothetical protein|nr:hypothetical protein [Flavobacteriia bacterium]
MGIYQRLALASVVLAIVLMYVINPIRKIHLEKAVENGTLYLESQAAEAGFQGGLVTWGSSQLAEMAITVDNYESYGLFSTADVYVAGIKRGESFGCGGNVWILWEELSTESE